MYRVSLNQDPLAVLTAPSVSRIVVTAQTCVTLVVGCLLTLAGLVGSAAPTLAQVFPPIVTEENLRNAILGNQSFSDTDLVNMDINFDGSLDVTDLVFFLNSEGEAELNGYKWLVLASFNSELGSATSVPYDYSFVLSVDESAAVSATIDEWDPTKGLLKQNLSSPGEVPGANRSKYAPSLVLPEGTLFSKSETGSFAMLTSSAVSLPAADPSNPTGIDLVRTWIIEIDQAAIVSSTLVHGSITERTDGFLPANELAETSGTITLVRFMPIDLIPLEMP